jgi:hypothetical protein
MRSADQQEDFLMGGRFGEGAQSPTLAHSVRQMLARISRRAIFPHAASAWWIPFLLALGWGQLVLIGFLIPNSFLLALLSVYTVALCSILAVLSAPVQALRLLMHFLNRPKPE